MTKRLIDLSLLGLLLAVAGGCAIFKQQTPPMEGLAFKIADAVVPAIQKTVEKSGDNLALQGGIQGLNPTYRLGFEALWVTGLKGWITVGVEGVAGQIQMTAIGEKAPVTPVPPVTP